MENWNVLFSGKYRSRQPWNTFYPKAAINVFQMNESIIR